MTFDEFVTRLRADVPGCEIHPTCYGVAVIPVPREPVPCPFAPVRTAHVRGVVVGPGDDGRLYVGTVACETDAGGVVYGGIAAVPVRRRACDTPAHAGARTVPFDVPDGWQYDEILAAVSGRV
jgi:hypothetical protein